MIHSGKALDALIAEKVMGLYQLNDQWIQSPKDPLSPIQGIVVNLPHYSTDISAAWEVVEKFHHFKISQDENEIITAILFNRSDDGYCNSYGRGNTVPHAICLAALKAISK